MARCSCGSAACSCVVKGKVDGGILVTGSGSPERPYLLELETGGNPLDSLQMLDSPTVKWTKAGAGIPTDKLRYTAAAEVAMQELTDVSKTDVPVAGDVVQWSGTEWVFAPPGATAVPVSGIWGTSPLNVYGSDSTVGRAIYLDSNGEIRTQPLVFDRPAGITSTSGPTSYPRGVSVMRVLGADNTLGSGWPLPVAAHGHVETQVSQDRTIAVQTWRRDTSTPNAQAVWQRTYSAGAWLPWIWIGGSAPYYSAYRSTVQTLTTANTWYTTSFDTVDGSEGAGLITQAAGVFTVPFPGRYQVNYGTHMQNTTTTSTVRFGILQNGTSILEQSNAAVGANRNWVLSRSVKCAAGDTIAVRGQSTQAAVNFYGAANLRYTFIDITLTGG